MFRQCPDLMAVINSTSRFDLVLDFSCYEPKWIHDNFGVLKGKVGGVCTRVEWFSTFLRISNMVTLLPIRYNIICTVCSLPINRRVGPCAHAQQNFLFYFKNSHRITALCLTRCQRTKKKFNLRARLEFIEEGWNKKTSLRSLRLFGGQNVFNSLPRSIWKKRMNFTVSSKSTFLFLCSSYWVEQLGGLFRIRKNPA